MGTGNVFRNNLFDWGGQIIWIAEGFTHGTLELYGNVFYSSRTGNAKWISHKSDVTSIAGLKIINNTIVNCSVGGRIISGVVKSGEIRNNIFINSWFTFADIPHSHNAGNVSSGESSWQVITTALFTDYANGVFTLASATNAGQPFPFPYNTDRLGKTRGADGKWDRGAYEFGGTVSPSQPSVTISAWDANATEAAGNAGTLRITRSIVSPSALAVNLAIGGTASNGTDYHSVASLATIPANATFVDVVVTPNQDTAIEGNETVALTITTGSGYTIGGPGTAMVTITDDDATSAPQITAQPASRAVSVGQTAQFSVAASGTPAPSYQWQKNGVAISGATAASYTTPATVAGDSGAIYRVVVRNSAGNVTSANATLTVNAVVNGWENHAFAAQTGTFTSEFDVTPQQLGLDTVIGLSSGAAGAYQNLACIVRFNESNVIDARNGAVYGPSTIPYSAGTSYRFRLVVRVAQHTYDIFVKPQGGSEVVVGQNYAFRGEQATVASLANWAKYDRL